MNTVPDIGRISIVTNEVFAKRKIRYWAVIRVHVQMQKRIYDGISPNKIKVILKSFSLTNVASRHWFISRPECLLLAIKDVSSFRIGCCWRPGANHIRQQFAARLEVVKSHELWGKNSSTFFKVNMFKQHKCVSRVSRVAKVLFCYLKQNTNSCTFYIYMESENSINAGVEIQDTREEVGCRHTSGKDWRLGFVLRRFIFLM